MKMTFFRRNHKLIAAFLLIGFISEWIFPIAAYGLTSGPSQPEVQSFEPYGTSDMVDLFSGDFVYNIPLGDVGGYPINLSYHGGVAMEQEASWVGLGWNFNPGVVNRSMRGIPDDFHGVWDNVKREFNMKPNKTLGAHYSGLLSPYNEAFGYPIPTGNKLSVGVYYNNYKGIGYKANMSYSPVEQFGFNYSFDSQDPTTKISPYLSFGNFSGGFSYSGDKGVESFYLNQNLLGNPLRPAYKPQGSIIGYHNQSYVPVSNPNMYFASYNLSFKYGNGNSGLFNSPYPIDATYSEFGVRQNEKSKIIPAYGYMHSADGYDKPDGIMDFNRYADNQPSKVITRLGIPQMTNDIYMVSGQGAGGHFRAHLPGAVSVKDPVTYHSSVPSVNVGNELGLGALPHFGLDLGVNIDLQRTGPWLQNPTLSNLMLAKKKTGLGGFENWYFKIAGEKDEIDMEYYNNLHGDSLIYTHLSSATSLNSTEIYSEDVSSNEGAKTSYNSTMHREKRAQRNSAISSLLVIEKDWCVQSVIPNIQFVTVNGNLVENYSSINRDNEYRMPNHITQIENINPDGTRYIYGIPAYNIKQKEVSFSVDTENTRRQRIKKRICNTNGYVEYPPTAASTGNQLGVDNFFQSQEISPYTYAHLLSDVLSPDYYDVDGNGPSTNDRGTYTHFNYSLIHTNYQWRNPYTPNKDRNGNLIANGMGTFIEGNMSDPTDDKAGYVYGEKENWILHSIETKTHVALFIISDREDGLSILDEKGGKGTQRLKKLDKIIILTIEEYKANQGHLQNAIPEKTIHFSYDYSLCKKIPNNSGTPFYYPDDPENNLNHGGKLTLKAVWYTYGTNEKGKFNSYHFDYNDDANFDYSPMAQDGWGNYKMNLCGHLNNNDLPYVSQNKTTADLYASAWSLSEIELPTGGTITINLESDDYSYVQDKPSMVMTKVVGFGETNNPNNMSKELYQSGLQKRTNRFIFFEISQSLDPDKISDLFPSDSSELFYQFLIDLTGKGAYETVSGYLNPISPGSESHIGISTTTGGTKYGWIHVKAAKINARDINPITRDAFQLIKTELPHLVFPSTDAMKGSNIDKNILSGRFSLIPKTLALIAGLNTYMLGKKMAQEVLVDGSSVIRLYPESGVKFGGGARVKSILFTDQWNEISGDRTFTTGIKYDYTIKEEGKVISSGVASIEPPTLVEESALYLPVKEYSEEFRGLIGMSNKFVLSGPLGLDYYPGASVGYSQVTVSSLGPDEIYNDPSKVINRHDNGYTVNEFYTAKEFPVRATMSTTEFKRSSKPREFLLSLLFGVNITDKSLSQGFLIETNDMHGKFKSSAEFSKLNPGTPIRKETHYYKVKEETSGQKHLDNLVTVLHKTGKLVDPEVEVSDPSIAIVGKEVEVVFDNKHSESFSFTGGIEGNLDFVLIPPVVVPVPVIYPSVDGLENHNLYTSSTTKIVRVFGLIDRVVIENESASITTKNIAYDAVTGEVLLTKTETEYKDHLYSLNYPAYWAHDGMGPTSINHRYTFELSIGSVTNGLASVSEELFHTVCEGDVLKKISGPGTISKAWILTKNIVKDENAPCNESLYDYQIVVIDESGKILPSGTYEFDIMESGRKNMQTLSMSSVLSASDPMDYTNDRFGRKEDFEKVIQASAVGYTNRRKVFEEQYQFVSEPSLEYWKLIPTSIIQKAIYNGVLLAEFTDITDLFEPPTGSTFNSHQMQRRDDFIIVFQDILGTTIDKMRWCPKIDENGDLIINIQGHMAICNASPESPIQFRIKKISGSASFSDINKYNTNGFNSLSPLCNGWGNFYSSSPYNYQQLHTGNSTICSSSTIGTGTGVWMFYYYYTNETSIHHCNTGSDGPLITKYEGLRANPYVEGFRSSWITENSYTYYDTRDNENARQFSGTGNTLNPQNSGYLKDFLPFYLNDCHTPNAFGKLQTTNSYGYHPWVTSATLTIASTNGNELESENALKIPQAALYGYNGTLPIAVGQNSKYSELVFDNFEEPFDVEADIFRKNLKWLMHIPYPYNSALTGNLATISKERSHSGISSMKVPSGGKVAAITDLVKPTLGSNYPNYTPSSLEFVIGPNNLIRGFKPIPGKTYTASYWAYDPEGTHELNFVTNNNYYSNPHDILTFSTINQQLDISPCSGLLIEDLITRFKQFVTDGPYSYWNETPMTITSQIIAKVEGWKLYKVDVTIPVSTDLTHIKIVFDNESGTTPIYIDDFRIFPSNGKMESYVYHPVNKRVLARLDENNYAMFYEYDEEGKLVRVKRETEKGIITIRETRQNIRIKSN